MPVAEIATPVARRDVGPRRALLIAAIGFVLSLGSHLPILADRFDESLEGLVGGNFHGMIQKTYDRAGFFALRGKPVLYAVPTRPPTGYTYIHHPPLFMWLTRPV